MQTWRLLDTPPMTGAENMALDETLVELRGQGKTPNTIHFLQFSPRTALVGLHQSVREEIREDYCAAHGIGINRRITGGGGLFFDESQLGWEVICDKAFFNLTLPTAKLFRTLCEPLIIALGCLGVRANFRPRNDVEVNGRKISGTGGTESGEAFLFQGTILTDFDVDTMLRALRIPVEKLKAKEVDSVKERVTCLKWELGRTPPPEEIKDAIRAGFERGLGIRLKPGGLTHEEERLFQSKLPHFQSHAWIHAVDPEYKRREAVRSTYKSGAGMVRFTLAVDMAARRLRDVYITGDFLSFPARALYDMEAALRGMPLERDLLLGVIREFFDSGRIAIPDMEFEDFVKPLEQALAKIAITRFGLTLEDCNRISVVNGSFEEVLAKKPSALLLPYCAKLTDCELRHSKDCSRCNEGGCTIGPAWEMGLQRHMSVRSVVSYEDLWAELMRLKSKGVQAYIGCCCQPFYAKHVDDFKRAGLPGILLDIDNTTCYDLDQAKEAYAGHFESQTSLDLGLLEHVLAAGALP